MFNRLLENIGTNPSSIGAINSYKKRLLSSITKRRWTVVLLGVCLMVLLLLPTLNLEKSLRYSDEHIINGIYNKQDIVEVWDNSQFIRDFYTKFGINRQDILSIDDTKTVILHSAPENNLWFASLKTTYPDDTDQSLGKTPISFIVDNQLVSLAPLEKWNTAKYSEPNLAFKGRNSTTGDDFWILKDSGNYVQIGKTIANDKPLSPGMELKKTIRKTDTPINDGTYIEYVYEYRNYLPQSVADNVTISDKIDLQSVMVDDGGAFKIGEDGTIKMALGNLSFSNWNNVTVLKLKLKSSLNNNFDFICNKPMLLGDNLAIQNRTVDVYSPLNNSECNKPITRKSVPSLFSLVKNVSKKTDYQTSNMVVADPGDVLEYKLVATNTSDNSISSQKIENNVSDLLDYADIDASFLLSRAGEFNTKDSTITWQNQTIPAQKDLQKYFRIKLKDTIPVTNKPSHISQNFDCKLSNSYGNSTTVNVACPIIKKYEDLPTISRAELLLISFVIFLGFLHFYFRDKLILKEISLLNKITGQSPNTRNGHTQINRMTLLRDKLPISQRIFSRITHANYLETAGDVLSETLFRAFPGFIASITLAVTLSLNIVVSSHYGYDFNYLLCLEAYIAGYISGILLERVNTLLKRK